MSSVVGEFVTETFDYGGGRQVTVYVPPDSPAAVVFAGDGQVLAQWGEVLEAADVPPTLIVGVHRVADETLRLQEYSPHFAPERFAAHEKFSSRTSAAGRGHDSVSRWPPDEPQCAESRPVGSWRSLSRFDIRRYTARSSVPLRARVTSRLP